jgi:hypothetical protein
MSPVRAAPSPTGLRSLVTRAASGRSHARRGHADHASSALSIPRRIHGFASGSPPRSGAVCAPSAAQHFCHRLLGAAALVTLLAAGLAPASAQSGSSLAGDAPLIPWQRTLDDALALSQQTGKPLLVAVNADGEVASDSIARGRYRDPEFAKLVEGFIPVIASPVTHAPRDRDGRGVRIVCPRFGTVTCAEHQAIEPDAYARWFDGTRVTPRHVGVSKKGEVLFDLYLLSSLSQIDRALEQHGESKGDLKDAAKLSDSKLFASRDAAARTRLEQRFLEAPLASRKRWAEQGGSQPGLLVLALRDGDASVRAAALESVVDHAVELPTDVLSEAAREAWGDRLALAAVVAGLELRAGDPPSAASSSGANGGTAGAADGAGASSSGDGRARRLATVLGGAIAEGRHRAVDPEAWTAALAAVPSMVPAPTLRDSETIYALVGQLGETIEQDPAALGARYELATALVEMADASMAEGAGDVSWLWEQAKEAALEALDHRDPLKDDAGSAKALLGAWAALARSDWELGGLEVAADAAANAVRPAVTWEAAYTLAAVDALHVLVQARFEQIAGAQDADQAIEPVWAADLADGARALMVHPLAEEWQQVAALDAVAGVALDGLHRQLAQAAVIERPKSSGMHEHLRWTVLRDGDALALIDAYDELLSKHTRSGLVKWYAAYGALAAGDRLRDEGRTDDARTAYAASLERFEAAGKRDSSLDLLAECTALVHAGLAAACLADGELEQAVEAMLTAAATSAAALDLPDGNEDTPRKTGRALSLALRRADKRDLATKVDDALAGK